MRMDAPDTCHGITLVELLATTAILAIVAALAAPGMKALLERQRTASALHALTTRLALARTAAITSRTPVTFCPSRGDGHCTGGTDWSAGWLVYRDPQRRSQPRGPGDILRNEVAPVHGSIRILSSSGRVRVRYQPAGLAPGANLTFRICHGDRLHAEVVVNNGGRARSREAPKGTPCMAGP